MKARIWQQERKVPLPVGGSQQVKLILASASPRRQRLLTLFAFPFTIKVIPIEETPLPAEEPGAVVKRLALGKASTVVQMDRNATVIGADTVVVLDGKILGKPRDEQEAWQMLRQLRDKSHEVISGVAVVREQDSFQRSAIATTKVFMRNYSDSDISEYIASGDPFDKAGAYAIQHPEFHPVDHIEGSYSNVVGLPLCQLLELLREAAIPLRNLTCEYLESRCLEIFPFPNYEPDFDS